MRILSILVVFICALLISYHAAAQDGLSSSKDPATLTYQSAYPRVREARSSKAKWIKGKFATAGVAYPPQELLLRIFKTEGILEVWARDDSSKPFSSITDFRICSSSGNVGPKRKEGDLQVPEGFYRVIDFNPASSYHLSLKINYPNASDKIRSDKRRPGGLIFIHGNCVTIGCIPITDDKIKSPYVMALDTGKSGGRTHVHIYPLKMDEKGMAWLEKLGTEHPDLLAFWRELQPGYAFFEHQKRIPEIIIAKDGRYAYPETATNSH